MKAIAGAFVKVFTLIFASIIRLSADIKVILLMIVILMAFWFSTIYLISDTFFSTRPLWATFLFSFMCSTTSYTTMLLVIFINALLSKGLMPDAEGVYSIGGFITTITGVMVVLLLSLCFFICYYCHLNFFWFNIIFYGLIFIRLVSDILGAVSFYKAIARQQQQQTETQQSDNPWPDKFLCYFVDSHKS